MSSFNAIIADANTSATNTSVTNAVDEIYEFSVDLLPEFMTESSMFIMTMDMCPGSTTFPFLKSKVPTNLKKLSQEAQNFLAKERDIKKKLPIHNKAAFAKEIRHSEAE